MRIFFLAGSPAGDPALMLAESKNVLNLPDGGSLPGDPPVKVSMTFGIHHSLFVIQMADGR